MVSRLQEKDLPQPWHSSRKRNGAMQTSKSNESKGLAVEDRTVQSVEGERKRRGRPPGKSAARIVAPPPKMKKMRPSATSVVNVLRGVASASIVDVDELRCKRMKDAEASGRTVRTVSPNRRTRKSPNNISQNCTQEYRVHDDSATAVYESRLKTPPPSRSAPSTEESPIQKETPSTVLEEGKVGTEPKPSHRPGKEPLEDHVDHRRAHYKRQRESLSPSQRHVAMDNDSDVRPGSRHRIRGDRRGRTCVAPSPTKRNSKHRYERREIELSDSSDDGLDSRLQRIEDLVSMKPRRELSKDTLLPDSQGRQQWQSQSPGRERGGHSLSIEKDWHEHYEYPSHHRLKEEYRNSVDFYSRKHRHRGHYHSSSPENSRRHKARRDKKHGRSFHRRSTTSYSSLSPPRRPITSRDGMTMEWADASVKVEGNVQKSTASDRRRRRHEQAILDTEKVKRQRNGNKPFYLTLDREGKPYGIGKPAWIADINKLAKGLDPSCTNIRKQTFEDVQTFKSRLDDNFEYSGILNDNYLRALMGKAVTKKRSELICLIKNKGKQPSYVDKEVWHRLQKLATSKQREDKSEQGRHANACRKTLGRTGCRGIDGVREKLRSFLGRSPDPSEVEEEMQRDKGYGGQRRNKRICSIEEEKNCKEPCSVDEDGSSQRMMRNSEEVNSDSRCTEPKKREVMVVAENSGGCDHSGIPEGDVLARTIGNGQGSVTVTESNMSNEEYVRELEAEIKLLRQRNAMASSSNADMPPQLVLHSQIRAHNARRV